MSYKEAKGFKGFESIFHKMQMEAKMHLYTLFALFLLHLTLVFTFMYQFNKDILELVWYVFSSFRVDYFGKAFKLLFLNTYLLFFMTLPVYLLYPILLGIYKKKSKEIMEDKHLRGMKLIEDTELIKIVKRDADTRDSIMLGRVPLPQKAETRHLLITGRPGTGKTTLLYQVLDKLRERNAKVVLHDFKGDYLSMFYKSDRDIIFNPLDKRSVNWCLFNEIETLADIDSIAASLITHTHSSNERFWVDAARDVFASILHLLLLNKETTNQALYRYSSMIEAELISVFQEAAFQTDAVRRAIGYLQGYEKGSKVASDVLATMKQYTNCFYYSKHLSSEFSIKEWLDSDKGGFVFVSNYANIQETLRPLLSLFIDTTLKHLLSMQESNNVRAYFLLDEFASLQRLTSIVRALETGRSKGASIWISLQDISQLQKLYSHETANTIVNTCNTIVSFALNDVASCEYLSRLIGDREILETDESLSMGVEDMKDGLSITRKRKTDRLILPSQFTQLPDFHFYLKMLNYDVTKTFVERIKRTTKHDAFILQETFKIKKEKEDEKEGTISQD